MPQNRRPVRAHGEPIPLWAIIGQEADPFTTADSTGQTDVLVTYETRSGVVDTIRVPRALYTAEYVAEQVGLAAKVHDEIAHLKGD